jgi:hypothetical protein
MAYTSVIDVMLLLFRDGTVQLALRPGTGFAGIWTDPHGDGLRLATMRH